ncbi:DUF7269 family protein [Natrononativus amylolyticus]|uniref:DUF7269 family protein n=1 Tax=Natrononativus amylolyticus TaxID=2963434 RepID=UPI0020CCA719|nr:hypothetical protein [Natrononativus amylolyticus]
MNARRIGLGAAGALLVTVALLTPAAGALPVEAVEGALGNDLYVVGVVALLGVLLAAPILVAGRSAAVEEAEMPDPEAAVSVPHAGAAVDDRLETWWLHLPVVGRSQRAEIRDRLEDCAVRTVQRTHGCGRETARELVSTGEWTDDERVRRFLSGGRPPLSDRVGALVGGTPWFAKSVRLTVDELGAQHGRQYGGDSDE